MNTDPITDTTTDRLAIIELLNRHQVAIDLRDGDAYADLFTVDGRFESPFAEAIGRDELKAMSLGLHASGFTEGKRHYLGPVKIDVDGDDARALSYWWVADTQQPPSVYSTGTYVDRLRRIDGHWKIDHRTQYVDQPVRSSDATSGTTG